MELKKEELIKELQKEQKELEDKAFKLYCKDALTIACTKVKDAENSLARLKEGFDNVTMESLREKFENRYINTMGKTVKQQWIDIVTEKK